MRANMEFHVFNWEINCGLSFTYAGLLIRGRY